MGKYRQVDKEDMENEDEILSCFQKSLPHAFSRHLLFPRQDAAGPHLATLQHLMWVNRGGN